MKRRQLERMLTKELAKRLHGEFQRVFHNKIPSRNQEILRVWRQYYGHVAPPLQPEIDLILIDDLDTIRAVEVKYFERKGSELSQPFYSGIDQALALLQWGFDNVALWQLFEEGLSNEDLRRYGCRTWRFVHGFLGLPIDFSVIRVMRTDEIRFQVVQADWGNDLTPMNLLDVDDPNFHITWRHPNLLYFTEEAKILKKLLIDWLK